MIYLNDHADTFPVGLYGTPFEQVYRAVRSVAAQVWAINPEIYRAGMAWGWYATHKPDALAAFRDVVVSALISAQAPMIKATQTNAELVEYLRQWREYRPTFPRLQSLYTLFGAVVDIQPISDPESQAVLPVDNTRLAFYLRVESVDPERPLSLSDAITIAVRATPMGSRPYAYYVQESRVTVPVALAPAGVTLWVENDTVASDPPPLPVYGIPMGGMMSPTGHSTYYVPELPEQITVDNIMLSGFMIPSSSLEEYFGNDQLEPESITINDNDVIIPLYDFDVPVTDQSKLYGVMRLNGTGSGSIPEEDDISKPLMLKATQDNSSVSYGGATSLPYIYSYSMDGTTWINYSLNTVIPLNKDEVVYFKRVGHTGSGTTSAYNHHKFTMTGEIEAYHNVNSMLIEGDFETADSLTEEYCGTYMFAECASLTRAPMLPATTLAEYCYYCMFYMCTNLVNAPDLPATTLARFCYSDMFHGCANLVNTPELPVMALSKGCYNGMFYDCPSLLNAPMLPATTLVEACYKYMFGACTNLSYIHIFATDISATNCLTCWLQNASSTGDIYCVNGVNYPTGDNGIPSGWTRHDI